MPAPVPAYASEGVPSLRGAPKKLAVLVFGGLGDVVLFSPALRWLVHCWPNTHITLMAESRSLGIAPLLEGVEEIQPLQVQGKPRPILFWELWNRLRVGGFDSVVSCGSSPFIPVLLKLSGIPRRAGYQTGRFSQWALTHPAPLKTGTYAGTMYLALAEAITGRPAETGWEKPAFRRERLAEISSPPEILSQLQSLKHQHPHKPVLLIHPGVSLASVSKNILKAWPVAHWEQLIRQCAERYSIAIAGGPDDTEVMTGLHKTLADLSEQLLWAEGKTKNLLDLMWLITGADVLASVDSAPMHLAIGLGVPVVTMFGPTDEQKLLPPQQLFSPSALAVTVPDLACRPCLWEHRNASCDNPVCLAVPVEAMQQAIVSMASPHSVRHPQ